MKYIRKIVAMLICVVFFTALVISLGFVFAIKNINVTLVTYADEQTYTQSRDEIKKSLDSFKGGSLLMLSEEEIIQAVADSNYTVASCEKVFPCTINITLKERLETFAVSVGGYYSMYDNDGQLLRYAENNANVNDGTPNVEIMSVPVEQIKVIASYASIFKSTFGGLRSIVSSISLDVNPDIEGYTEKLYFNLRCGLKIQLDNYQDGTEEKIKTIYTKFCTLTDRQKLKGTLRGYRIGGDDGLINSDYSTI